MSVGIYPDFDTNWYFINGDVIVQTMILNCFMPAMTIGVNYAKAYAFIWWDKRGKQATKCDTIQSYISIYGGQEFAVHVRYSNMLNILFMTMMYGAALPLLYPIAMFSFAVLYVQDITLLVYFAEAPPSYDNDLNNRFISIM